MNKIEYSVTQYDFTDRVYVELKDGLSICVCKTNEGYVLDAFDIDGDTIFTETIWHDDYKYTGEGEKE